MKNTEILQRDAEVLRKKAKLVPAKDIGSKKLNKIIERMKTALHGEDDGVAIAAPQIGESLRIFVVNGKALTIAGRKKGGGEIEDLSDMVFINPEITRLSKKKRKMEEGCLSIRWLYGQVNRSEKANIKAYNENGEMVERGASGLLAQIFQHEIDHLDGILFIDKAENVEDIPPERKIRYAFFGSSRFSEYVLEELEKMGHSPAVKITSAKSPLPIDDLKNAEADVFIVASFGKILPQEITDLPPHKTLNVHPSLLPKLRGASPIQNTILGHGEPGVTIIRMDEKMDHGPILAQAKVSLSPWPDHYAVVEEKLGRLGGQMLGMLLPQWIDGKIPEKIQDDSEATFTKFIKKEDGLISPLDPAQLNMKKVMAYSTWPGAYMNYMNKYGKEIRLIVKDAKIEDGKFVPTIVVPAGKREMTWQEFLRGN